MVLPMLLMMAGATNRAIGSFYAAQSQKYTLKSQASEMDFQAGMSQLGASMARDQGYAIDEQAKASIGQRGLEAGQVRGMRAASTAGAGIVGGAGSAAELAASDAYAHQMDVYTINSNAVRARNEARMAQVGLENQALIQRTNAATLRRMSRTIRPWAAVSSSLLGSAGNVASMWGGQSAYTGGS